MVIFIYLIYIDRWLLVITMNYRYIFDRYNYRYIFEVDKLLYILLGYLSKKYYYIGKMNI